ncbi:MAG: ParB N-terminal domain-containing protein [Fibrobacterota bacterium]
MSETVRIVIDRIERKALKFCFSYGFCLQDLRLSIRNVGMISPPVLKKSGCKYDIVCGYKRIEAALAEGYSEADCIVLPDETSEQDCMKIALNDNLSFRELNIIEKMNIVKALRLYRFPSETIEGFENEFGLRRFSAGLMENILFSGDEFKSAAAAGLMPPESIIIAARFKVEERELLASLFRKLTPGKNKQIAILENLSDISARDETSMKDILESAAIKNLIENEQLNPPQKLAKILSYLEALRNPEISEFFNKYKAKKKTVSVPSGIEFSASDILEERRHRIAFSFCSSSEAMDKASQLRDFLNSQSTRELIDLEP